MITTLKSESPASWVRYFENFKKMITQPLPEMQQYFDAELAYLSKLATPNSRVLDVGCGPARVMKQVGPHVKHVVGIERDSRMIGEAKKALSGVSGSYEFWDKDFFDIEPKGDFDVAFASYNFPGADDVKPGQRLELLKRMVQHTRSNGGHAIISFWKPTDSEWLERYYNAAGAKIEKTEGTVVHTSVGTFTRFTDEEIKELADGVGVPYTVAHITPMFDLVHFRP